jgi:NAD(P)-dependent dehydrogenase (short-subunit alcohol dehydrogenase family)
VVAGSWWRRWHREGRRARAARAGHPVALWDASAEAAEAAAGEVAAFGVEALAIQVDVLSPESITGAAERTVDRFGSVSRLVTCAGTNHFQHFVDISLADWHQMIGIHLTGTFLAAQAVTPSMRNAGFGSMVSVASMAGLSGSARHVHYAAAKAGIIGFAKALAKELGPDGITVNVVAPGTIDTPMIRNVPPEIHARYAGTPVGRIGQVEDVAHVVSMFLAEESSFTTGAVLNVNGGAYV